MKVLRNLQVRDFNVGSFKTLMVVAFIYPILPLALCSTVVLFYGFGSLFVSGFQHHSISQIVLQFLLFSGGFSGLIGGIMVLMNRINLTSLSLFLHGAVCYMFIAAIFLFRGIKWESLWFLHGVYLAITLLVVSYQFYLIVAKVLTDYQIAKLTKS